MYLISTRHVTNCNHELINPWHRFSLIAHEWLGWIRLAFPRPFRSVWKYVQFPGRYKSPLDRLPFRIPHLRNSTVSLVSSLILNTMPPARTFDNRSFYPFPIDYSSETFTPLVRLDRQISHVKYLLRGNPAAIARFRHYLTTCTTIFSLERTIHDLQTSRDHVFEEFVTPDVVRRLQPFLIQTRRRSQAPPSTTVIDNVWRQQVLTPIPTRSIAT